MGSDQSSAPEGVRQSPIHATSYTRGQPRDFELAVAPDPWSGKRVLLGLRREDQTRAQQLLMGREAALDLALRLVGVVVRLEGQPAVMTPEEITETVTRVVCQETGLYVPPVTAVAFQAAVAAVIVGHGAVTPERLEVIVQTAIRWRRGRRS